MVTASRPPVLWLAMAPPVQHLLEGQAGHIPQKYAAGGIDQLQLGQIDGQIPAGEAAFPGCRSGAGSPAAGLRWNRYGSWKAPPHVVFIVVAAQKQVQFAARCEQGAIRLAQRPHFLAEDRRVDPSFFPPGSLGIPGIPCRFRFPKRRSPLPGGSETGGVFSFFTTSTCSSNLLAAIGGGRHGQHQRQLFARRTAPIRFPTPGPPTGSGIRGPGWSKRGGCPPGSC